MLHTLQGPLRMPVHVLHWLSLIWSLNVPGPLPPPALDFDQSVEALERQRVIDHTAGADWFGDGSSGCSDSIQTPIGGLS